MGVPMEKRPESPLGRVRELGILVMAAVFLYPLIHWKADQKFNGWSPAVLHAQEKGPEERVRKLKADPLYKAVKLTWSSSLEGNEAAAFEILRSQAKPEGPYSVVSTLEGKSGVHRYEFVDKNLPVEENYFYKVRIQGTNEVYGPVQVRPPFSLPTT